ncbi:MAG TPA: RimK family alpha-L-glutamate ligase [Candidatus Thermoplasmatota archaeon]|nr:RimK family alpha-L-glutamate ligase [Candidatus Thermoplasmatota archaeon]
MAHVAIVSDASSRDRAVELEAMQLYIEQAPDHGHTAAMLDVDEFARLPEFDAAFLRLDTSVLGLPFAVSRYAWKLGLRIVDDPKSMLTCMNKAHVQGLLERAGVPTPDTVLLTKEGREHLDAEAMFKELGTPIVVKAPSGAFSSAVEKAHDAKELRALVRRFTFQSDVILLQRFTPSTYDWRVGVLCGDPIYAARYHIPKGGWRIHDTPEGSQKKEWAKIERVPLGKVPYAVMETALAACREVGNSLYGVDLKQREDGTVVVIEVNDNPNIDPGGELPKGSPVFGQIIDRIAREGPRA